MTPTTLPAAHEPAAVFDFQGDVDSLRRQVADTLVRACQTRNHVVRLLQDVAALDHELSETEPVGLLVLLDNTGRDLIDTVLADIARHSTTAKGRVDRRRRIMELQQRVVGGAGEGCVLSDGENA